MTQRNRDRLVVRKKGQKWQITRKRAAAELQWTERQVRRLLKGLKAQGDNEVIHALRGRPSNRKLNAELRQKAISILLLPEWRDFGPTLASYHLEKDHGRPIHLFRKVEFGRNGSASSESTSYMIVCVDGATIANE